MPTEAPEDSFFKFREGKIPKISYLLSEGLIKIVKENDELSFEDYTDLTFKLKNQQKHVVITCNESGETYNYKL